MNKPVMLPAGTGKTLLGLELARKAALAGRRVLFLTYNKNIAAKIAECRRDWYEDWDDRRWRVFFEHREEGERVNIKEKNHEISVLYIICRGNAEYLPGIHLENKTNSALIQEDIDLVNCS